MKYTIARLLSISVALWCSALAFAQYNIIPQPRSIETKSDRRFAPKEIISARLPLPQDGENADSLKEFYSIRADGDNVYIYSYDKQGETWAYRTLDQLYDSITGTLPDVEIVDSPEFPLRGFMYDTGRNFIEVEQIEEFIDLISRYKLNAFHWHLTDKPAWRIESRAYPQLNDARYQRIGRDEGRFYTYADIRRVLDYASERGVMIIPEIDMPGHSDFFNDTFGFSMNSKQGMEVLTVCLREFFDEFSAQEMPYIHIGSDEIHIDNPDEFMAWAVKTVEDAGRIPIVWDPGLDAGENAVYQIWRDGLAAPETGANGKAIIDSYMGYLNYVDPMIMTNRLFLHAPCTTGHAGKDELGGILCMWNDVRVVDNESMPIHNGMMGGVLPFAERFWVGGRPNQPYNDVLRSPDDADMQRLMEFHQRMAAHRNGALKKELDYWQPNTPATKWEITISDSVGNTVLSDVAYGDVVDIAAIMAAHGLPLDLGATARLSRAIYSDRDTVVMCRIGFDAPARSNRLGDGIALQGKWENCGSVIVNGEPVLPPVWDQPGLYQYHYNTWARPEEELPYTDEQLYWTRKPVAIKLNAGENTIELSTRLHFAGQRFQVALLDL